MLDNEKSNRMEKSKKRNVDEDIKLKNAIVETDEEDTVKSERIRYKNADQIYE